MAHRYHYVCHIIDANVLVLCTARIFSLWLISLEFLSSTKKLNLSQHSCKQITIATLQNSYAPSYCSSLSPNDSPLIGVTIASADELKTHSVKLFIAPNSSWRRLFCYSLILICIGAHASNQLQRRNILHTKAVKRYHCSGIFIENKFNHLQIQWNIKKVMVIFFVAVEHSLKWPFCVEALRLMATTFLFTFVQSRIWCVVHGKRNSYHAITIIRIVLKENTVKCLLRLAKYAQQMLNDLSSFPRFSYQLLY